MKASSNFLVESLWFCSSDLKKGLTRKYLFFYRPYAFVSPGPILVVAWFGRLQARVTQRLASLGSPVLHNICLGIVSVTVICSRSFHEP